MAHVHEYRCRTEWSGTTGVGYESYTREHRVSVPPAESGLVLSGDPAFRGEARLLNPEQLLLVAASSCQLLSFIAIAARARFDIVSYTDDAEARMPEDDKPVRITHITLRPRIVVRGPVDEARVRRYVGLAHDECYIANSLRSEITIAAEIEIL